MDSSSPLIIELAWGLTIVALYIYFAMRFVAENERLVIFFDNRPVRIVGPGAVFVWPFIYSSKNLSVGARSEKVWEVVLSNGMRIPVSCTFVFRITDFSKAAISHEDLLKRTKRVIDSCLAEVLSAATIAECLSDKARLECRVADLANEQTVDWGIRVALVDFGDLKLPRQLLRTIMSLSDGISLQLLTTIDRVADLNALTTPEQTIDDTTKLVEFEPLGYKFGI